MDNAIVWDMGWWHWQPAVPLGQHYIYSHHACALSQVGAHPVIMTYLSKLLRHETPSNNRLCLTSLQQQYVTSTSAAVSWSEGTLAHNSNSIMRALTEPHSPAGSNVAFKNPISQAVYTTNIGQRPLPSPRLETQWSQFDGDVSRLVLSVGYVFISVG